MAKIVILKNETYLSSKSIYHDLEGGGRVSLENALNHIYPIGSIFITTVNQDPSPYLGGKWESFGAGRVLVGFDSSQTEFNTILKTGGSKYLQNHSHRYAKAKNFDYEGGNSGGSVFGGTTLLGSTWAVWGTTDGPKNLTTGNAGNLQPYIVVYMFKRIS